jgi:hypothetical protein
MISSLVRGRDWRDGRATAALDVDLAYDSDAGSLIFLGRFLISGLISGAARG